MRRWGLVGCLSWLLSTACATSPTPTHFAIDLKRDLSAAAGMFLVGAIVDREKTSWDQLTTCGGENRPPDDDERLFFETLEDDGGLCDDREVIWPDLWVTKQNWAPARRISDYLLFAMLGLPFGVSAVDTIASSEDGERFGVDAVVISQAYSATFLVGALLKVAVRRPRPMTYNRTFSKAERFEGDARLSFPSNHSSMAFASASVTSVMLLERYGVSTGTALGIGGAYFSAAMVGVMRMAAGKHFLTDVLVGAAFGTFFGIVVPSLHLEKSPGQVLSDSDALSSAPPDRVYFQVLSLGGAW